MALEGVTCDPDVMKQADGISTPGIRQPHFCECDDHRHRTRAGGIDLQTLIYQCLACADYFLSLTQYRF